MSYDILSILSSVIAILGYIPEIYYSLYNPEREIPKDLLDANFQESKGVCIGLLRLASPESNQVKDWNPETFVSGIHRCPSQKDSNIIYHNYYFTITYNHLKSTSWTLWSISSMLSIIYSCLNYQYLFLVNYGIILLFNILVMVSKNVKEIELTPLDIEVQEEVREIASNKSPAISLDPEEFTTYDSEGLPRLVPPESNYDSMRLHLPHMVEV